VEKGRGVWLKRSQNSRVCLAFTGSLYPQALGALQILKDRGIEADGYNLRFISQIDEEYLVEILNSYDLVVFAEEGIRQGGFGEYALSLAHCRNCLARTVILAVDVDFASGRRFLGTREELLKGNGLDSEGIANKIKEKKIN
jgi:1-deoxy-D-xylulose-5-phosphate synthase